MAIMPSPMIGFRGGDGVIPDSVGFGGISAALARELGFLEADLLLAAALGGSTGLIPSIISAINRLSPSATSSLSIDVTVE